MQVACTEIGVGMCICHGVHVSVFMPVADSIGQGVRIDRQHLHSGSVGARGTGSVGDSVGEGACLLAVNVWQNVWQESLTQYPRRKQQRVQAKRRLVPSPNMRRCQHKLLSRSCPLAYTIAY